MRCRSSKGVTSLRVKRQLSIPEDGRLDNQNNATRQRSGQIKQQLKTSPTSTGATEQDELHKGAANLLS